MNYPTWQIDERVITRDLRLRKLVDSIYRSNTVAAKQKEIALGFALLKKQQKIEGVKDFPYLWAYEWEVEPGYSQYGKGDLIFTDARGTFLIVELKYLNSNSGRTAQTRRRHHRKQVWEQALKYARCFQTLNPHVKVKYTGMTNECFWFPRIFEL